MIAVGKIIRIVNLHVFRINKLLVTRRSRTWRTTAWPRPTPFEAVIGYSPKATRYERKLRSDYVIISAPQKFNCDAGAAVALIQISRAGDVVIVLNERPIVPVSRAVGSPAWLHLIARAQHFDRAPNIFDRIAIALVDRKAVRRVTNQQHLLPVAQLID